MPMKDLKKDFNKDLLILNAAQIATPVGKTARCGEEMSRIKIIPNGGVFIQDGKIAAVGKTEEIERLYHNGGCEILDASGSAVVPGFVDSHTHFVFGGYREDEFLMRLEGRDYLSIMAAGGGIAATVKATRQLDEEKLFGLGRKRLDRMLALGVTTVEGKSGYGLDRETELRQLRVLRRLDREHSVDVVSTYLGGHAVPEEYAGNADGYLDFMIETMLPEIRQKDLAEFCDIFCETGVFSVAQSEKLLKAAAKLGFGLKIHADEMTDLGGAALAAGLSAVSADHLLMASPQGIEALAHSQTVATLLPATAFCLNKPTANGRRMIDEGCAVAIASDFNPGSCFTFSVPLLFSLACIKMGLTAEEALTALTLNGAAAVGRADQIGSLEPGKRADLLILQYPSFKFLIYNTAVNIVGTVIKNGRIVRQN